MNYVQIPESTAKILHSLAISAAAKVADQHEAEQAIIACGVLTMALGDAKPLPKKPGPKSKKLYNPLSGKHEIDDMGRTEAFDAFGNEKIKDWTPAAAPKPGDKFMYEGVLYIVDQDGSIVVAPPKD